MSRDLIRSARLPHKQGAESVGVRADGLIFTSGISGLGSDHGELFAPSRRAFELERALDSASLVLEQLGSGLERTAKVKLSVNNWSAFPACDQRYRQLLSAPFPARACVSAQLLDPRAGVSVELIAGADQGPVDIGCTGSGSPTGEPHPRWGTRLGDLLFSNGISIGSEQAGQDIGHQAETIFVTLAASLGAGDAAIRHVAKVNGTAASWHGFGAYNEIYKTFFYEPYAARASVQGTSPNVDALISVEAIASLAPDRRTVESEVRGAWHSRDIGRRADTIYSAGLHPTKGPHSHGVRAGTIIFAAGACPYDRYDRLVSPGDIQAQTRTTLDNLRLILRALDAEMDDIVKTNVTLSDIRLFPAFDAAYADYFTPPFPARQTVAAGLGQAGMLVEIEAIAVAGASRHSAALLGGAS